MIDRLPTPIHYKPQEQAEPETVQELARRMATATRNIRTVWATVHRMYHHEKHTLGDCPMASCVRMRKALNDLPSATELERDARLERKEAKALKVDGKVSPS